jgi:diguanylate cyclase (GGDEF)-like protein/PAS domain S-box-containing protein
MPEMAGIYMSKSAHFSSLGEFEALIDALPSPVIVKNKRHEIILINQEACDLFGHSRDVMLSLGDEYLFSSEEVHAFQRADERVFASNEVDVLEENLTDAKGTTKKLITRKQKIFLGGEELLIAVITDVTAVREAEARSRYLSLHDVLTGLPNRALLNERIDQALVRRARLDSGSALIYVDLDRFKEVNDTFGHQAGDDLVCQFAERLSGIVRACDTVARLGGDEFAILLQDTSESFSADSICERILSAAELPFAFDGGQSHISASVGLVEWTEHTLSRTELHRRADVALYQAKNEGRGCYRVFCEAIDEGNRARRLLEAELREALSSSQGLQIHYQPLFDATGDRVVAMEALVRWDHPRLGWLLPGDFLTVAEESGLIIPLGDWLLERACRTFSGWPAIGLAVNVSPVQLSSIGFVEQVVCILERTGYPPAQLQLEVTEHTMLDVRVASEKLKLLRDAGINIVLDDFGTGYSSLAHLQRLEIDKVKIDRSFVNDLDASEGSGAIVRAVLHLAKSLGLKVTAEGVETETQRTSLCSLGCEELQGYLLSRPLSEADAVALAEQHANLGSCDQVAIVRRPRSPKDSTLIIGPAEANPCNSIAAMG